MRDHRRGFGQPGKSCCRSSCMVPLWHGVLFLLRYLEKNRVQKRTVFRIPPESPEGPNPCAALGRSFPEDSEVNAIGGSRNQGSLEWLRNAVLKFVKLEYAHHDHRNRPHFTACRAIFRDEHPSASDFEVAQGKLDMIHGHMLRSSAGSSLARCALQPLRSPKKMRARV